MIQTTEQLIVDITNASISYGDSLEAGDSKKANTANSIALKAFDRLLAKGEQNRIFQLLEFAHPSVRLMAASIGMRIAPQRAEPVLRDLANGPNSAVCAMANSFLKFWYEQTPGIYQPLNITS